MKLLDFVRRDKPQRDYMVGYEGPADGTLRLPGLLRQRYPDGIEYRRECRVCPFLGVTTPAGLGSSVSHTDWANGLLIRFATAHTGEELY